LLSAYAISTNEIIVNASGNLLQRSTVLYGDATNPNTWASVRLDTNELVPIVSVQTLTPATIVLRTLHPLPSSSVQLDLQSNTLLDSLGGLVAIRILTFAGMTEAAYSTPDKLAVSKTISSRDLLNRQVPNENGSLSGTLVVKGGDYSNQSGVELLRKLILRRLIATPGDFYHLPNYGVGLRVKSPLPAGDLIKLQARVKQQIQQEQEVNSVTVTITQSRNVLFVNVSVTVKSTGSRLEVGMPFQLGGGS
jgi:hypothetical protein